ncbi:MAG: ETC complex I subunit [Alphaproteobacteria bacterium]|nr:ETC complex I subunit [Alphaproteobacteria bacterium]
MRVRVYSPAKSAAQSGRARSGQWFVEPEGESPRVREPIMGWMSAADSYSSLKGKLKFPSAEDAIAFVRGKGWEVILTDPAQPRPDPKSYMDNFRPVRPEDEELPIRS